MGSPPPSSFPPFLPPSLLPSFPPSLLPSFPRPPPLLSLSSSCPPTLRTLFLHRAEDWAAQTHSPAQQQLNSTLLPWLFPSGQVSRREWSTLANEERGNTLQVLQSVVHVFWTGIEKYNFTILKFAFVITPFLNFLPTYPLFCPFTTQASTTSSIASLSSSHLHPPFPRRSPSTPTTSTTHRTLQLLASSCVLPPAC